jgi:ABC-2 type transport system permease protein
MAKWLATMIKEWRLLIRDRTGVLLLFVMPAVLVVVITLVQDNVLRPSGALKIKGAIVDLDGNDASIAIIHELKASEVLKLIGAAESKQMDEKRALQLVGDGSAQFYIVIPKGFSAAVETILRNQMEALVAEKVPDPSNQKPLPELAVYFDPAVSAMYQEIVNGIVHQAVAVMRANFSVPQLKQALEDYLRQHLKTLAGPFPAHLPDPLLPSLKNSTINGPLVNITAHSTDRTTTAQLPTAVQQNVPAWALFGMFFIVVPLSGALIIERQDGILGRLMTMPVSRASLIFGKLGAYVGVCLVQFLCVVMVGKWFLPLLGTDALIMSNHFGAIIAVTLCSALAATGYGIMLGVLAHTSQQASVLGPISIVIAAALGGIMVPVFAMPPMMQVLSKASPLSWAHEAYMILMVRGGTLIDVWSHLTLLMLFFIITLGVAVVFWGRP